jgi:peroxiredoxin Q/BCP
MLEVGQQAPAFDAVASNGRRVTLESFLGKKNVVLYFYPRDFTRGCTAEACFFRDMYEDLVSRDTEVIGVSLDSNESHEKFAAKHNVRFPLVADADRSLAKRYEAIGPIRGLLGIVKRVTFVIDKRGKIAAILASEVNIDKHISGVKAALAKLAY